MNVAVAPPLFDASAPLAAVLDWDGLPGALRPALTRAFAREELEQLTFIDSLRSEDPRLREWQVGLLALDVGVDLQAGRDNLIGLFSQDTLGTALITRVCLHGVGPRQGFGAAFRAPTPTAPPFVCAAAYVYFGETGLVDLEFVFIGGSAPKSIAQLPLETIRGQPLDADHLKRTRSAVSGQLAALGLEPDRSTTALKEALLQCMVAREQQW